MVHGTPLKQVVEARLPEFESLSTTMEEVLREPAPPSLSVTQQAHEPFGRQSEA